MTQPTALFLADILEDACKPADIAEKCAAELRRLHAENAAASTHLSELMKDLVKIETQRDALLEALQTLFFYANTLEMRTSADGEHRAMQQARAAIKKAEDKQ
jgi:hypothetical protein